MPRGNLRKEDERKIRVNYSMLLSELDAQYLVDDLYSKEVIDRNDMQDIRGIRSRRDRTAALLERILDSGPGDSFGIFMNILKKEYEHVVDVLDAKKPSISDALPERASHAAEVQYDIFISYSWAQQPLVEKLVEHLKENTMYKIWFDKTDMSGQVLSAMAKGIEQSSLVIICISEEYQQSQNCNTEAVYSYNLKKKIIPVKVQKFKPSDWLGALIAPLLYFDLDSDFDGKIQDLCKEIDRKLAPQNQPQQSGGNSEASTENAS